jgi:hypothetical protein
MNIRISTLLLGCGCWAAQAHGQSTNDVFSVNDHQVDRAFYDLIRLHLDDLLELQSHPAILSQLKADQSLQPPEPSPLSDYETFLPHATQPRIPRLERAILTAYLENPADARLAEILALYHWNASLEKVKKPSGTALQHSVIAYYFLNRVQDLGRGEHWVEILLERTKRALDRVAERGPPLHSTEGAAHKYFIDAFNYHEGNRYKAVDGLLDEFVRAPRNVLTNAYLTASNIWIGGEAGYEDPTVLYSFVLSSYFSIRTIQLAQAMEQAWMKDPVRKQRFRLAPILGGWTVPARRWMARFHGDDAAVERLDAEHREWLAINRAFHSASVGLMLFEEDDKFAEGLAAWFAGFDHCGEVPSHTSCLDRPRFTFNNLSFLLGAIDYFLKAGQLDLANIFITLRGIPEFSYVDWDLGRGPWEHRERNLEAIAALYQNGDPSDDPTHFLLKKRKWGPSTITCQTCHQAQSKVWPPEEIDQVLLPHASVATIGQWPEFSTNWYGAIKR